MIKEEIIFIYLFYFIYIFLFFYFSIFLFFYFISFIFFDISSLSTLPFASATRRSPTPKV